MLTLKQKMALLVTEAESWNSITEQGGDNSGQLVEMIQKVVDGKAQKEAWCAAFVWWCLLRTENQIKALNISEPQSVNLMQVDGVQVDGVESGIYRSEWVWEIWNKTPAIFRTEIPVPGSLIVWLRSDGGKLTTNGHIGIVRGLNPVTGTVYTVEGNTGPNRLSGVAGASGGVGAGELVERNGDGVYLKERLSIATGDMQVQGFLNPWLD